MGSSSEFRPALVARATARAYGVAGLFGAFFIVLGAVAVHENPGSWPVLATAAIVATLMLANLARARLSVGTDGVAYRTLTTNRTLSFSEIQRARIETSVNRSAPQGVATFWIQPKEGRAWRVSLRIFPPQAVGALLAALERHGVALDVPETWAGRRVAGAIQGLPATRRPRAP